MTSICVVCGNALRPWIRKLDREVYRCPACSHIAVPAGLARTPGGLSIYEDECSVFCSDGNDEYYLDDSALLAAETRAAFVATYARSGGSLLDIGSGFGHFLAVIRDRYDATGLELSGTAVKWAREHFGIRARVGCVYDIPPGADDTCNLITAWDVIEHLEDPRTALRGIRRLLKDHGHLFLSTPDAGSAVARLMGRRWHYLDPVQHINLFSRENLERVLDDEGFAIVGRRSFGRRYRVRYVLNRLRYLAGATLAGRMLYRFEQTMPQLLARTQVAIKLWDVMGLAAKKVG